MSNASASGSVAARAVAVAPRDASLVSWAASAAAMPAPAVTPPLPLPAPLIPVMPALSAAGAVTAGVAELRAHHGEIVQGMFRDCDDRLEQALVTLPCSLYRTRVLFRPMRTGPLTVEPCDRSRARIAARLTLDAIGRTGWGGSIRIESSVPLGWGCGSSTTDVVTTIRAVADAFGMTLETEWIAMLSVAAEIASDSLMYGTDRAILFAQRRGRMLMDLGGPLPSVCVLGFNTESDAGMATLTLPPCRYSSWEIGAFQVMLGLLRRAVEQQAPDLLGRVATASTEINQRHRPKRLMPQLLQIARQTRALGLQVAHSGTVAGLLYEPGRDAARRVDEARARLRRLGLHASWEFFTDERHAEDDSGEHHYGNQRQFRGRPGPAAHHLAEAQSDRSGFPADEAAAGALHHPQGARGRHAGAGRPDRRVHLRHVRTGAGDGGAPAAASADAGQ